LDLLTKTQAAMKLDHAEKAAAIVAELLQKGDSLARNLATKRVYIDPITGRFDPRFLVFEFQSNVILRSRQVIRFLRVFKLFVFSTFDFLYDAGRLNLFLSLCAAFATKNWTWWSK
jgi:hypothetical protein